MGLMEHISQFIVRMTSLQYIKDVLLSTRRVLLSWTFYSDSALLKFSTDQVVNLPVMPYMALNWQYHQFCLRKVTKATNVLTGFTLYKDQVAINH